MPDDDIILAVDPGRDKCGVAVVKKDGSQLYKNIIPRSELETVIRNLALQYAIHAVIVGDGTTSGDAITRLRNIVITSRNLSVIGINEYRSTDEARKRYWRENPPKGLMRLIPVTMQVPPVPVDDYVAVILAERYFKGGNRKAESSKQ